MNKTIHIETNDDQLFSQLIDTLKGKAIRLDSFDPHVPNGTQLTIESNLDGDGSIDPDGTVWFSVHNEFVPVKSESIWAVVYQEEA